MSEADQTVDLLNNEIGRSIGRDNNDSSMQELALKTLDYYHEEGLWTAEKKIEDTYIINQNELSEEQYNEAYKILEELDDDGYKPGEN